MVKLPKLIELFNEGNSLLSERKISDQFYTDLPGFPAVNTIETPVQHVPLDYKAKKEQQTKTQEEEFGQHVIDVLKRKKDFFGLPTNTDLEENINLLKKIVEHIVIEELNQRKEKTTPFFNGMDGKSKTPKGGSAAFEKSRKIVFDDLFDDEGKVKYE
jgi:hypothetical protein